jgi:hypothetical protein
MRHLQQELKSGLTAVARRALLDFANKADIRPFDRISLIYMR